jgi:glycosyltransferase involved in cell wall biosynthesis
MHKTFRLSVVIPTFNNATEIEACLKAVSEQDSFELGIDYEVIVVDDGSQDDTVEVVKKFPKVQYIKLAQNMGRIEARRAGCEATVSDLILFVDARVRVAGDLLKVFFGFNLQPAYCGTIKSSEGEGTTIDRLFQALRRLYYGRGYVMKDEVFKVTSENFDKTPKGTGCLFCSKQMFLEAIPKGASKDTNDDTKILSYIVNDLKCPLYRLRELKIHYSQRQEVHSIYSWFTQRGVFFADYYISKGGPFFWGFCLVWSLIIAGLFLAVFNPSFLMRIGSLSLAIYTLGIVFLARGNLKDTIVFWGYVGFLGAVFWLGINKYFFGNLRTSKVPPPVS